MFDHRMVNLPMLPPSWRGIAPLSRIRIVLFSYRFWLGLGISLLCLWLAVRNIAWMEVRAAFQEVNVKWLILAILIQIISVGTRAERWRKLLEDKLGWLDSLWGQGIGYLFNNVFPLRTGEVARTIAISGYSRLPFVYVLASVVTERLLDLAIVVVGFVFLLPSVHIPNWVIRAGITLGVIAIIGLNLLLLLGRFQHAGRRSLHAIARRIKFLPQERILRLVDELLDGVAVLSRRRVFWGALGWTVLSWLTSVMIYYSILLAFRSDATILEAAIIVVILSTAFTIPSSPGYIGVFQYVGQQALVLPFGSKYGEAQALAITIVAHVVFYIITSLIGLIGLWRIGESFTGIGEALLARLAKHKAAADESELDG